MSQADGKSTLNLAAYDQATLGLARALGLLHFMACAYSCDMVPSRVLVEGALDAVIDVLDGVAANLRAVPERRAPYLVIDRPPPP